MRGGGVVDDVFKVEELQSFVSLISRKYRVKLQLERHLNKSEKFINFDSIREDLAVLEKIEFLYARDFDLFSYEKISKKNSYKPR